jgi:SAM-dependent methyltransferase
MDYVDLETQEIFQCPFCDSSEASSSSELPRVVPVGEFFIRYQFPDNKSPRLIKCDNCSSAYKNFYLDIYAESLVYNLWVKNIGNRWLASKKEIDVQRQLSIQIIEWFKNISGHTPNSIIDIGAGEGSYINYLDGYERFSLDQNPDSIKQNSQRGIQTILSDICSEAWVPNRSFNLVTCFDVLEHLHKPNVAIRNISKLLTAGGIFIGETGNLESFVPKYYGLQNWWYVNIPEHKVFWSKECLQSIFSKHGIDLVKIDVITHKKKSIFTLRNMKNIILLLLGLWPNKKQFRKIFLKDHFFIIGVKKS